MAGISKEKGRVHSRSSLRVLGRSSALAVAALVAMLAFANVSGAAEVYVRTASIGTPGAGDGELSLGEHSGVAVNQTTGNVYVADTGNGRVEEFEPDGTFVRVFGSLTAPTFIAIDDSTGDLYVADSDGSVHKFEGDGTQAAGWALEGVTTFTELKGIAVGPTGDLFVLNEESTVDRFSQSGAALGTFEAPRGSAVLGLAVDPEGKLYKADGTPEITRFTDTGENLGEPDTRQDALALAIDPDTGDLFVPQGNSGEPIVNRYALNCGQACKPLESFGLNELTAPSGVAIGPGGVPYIADAQTSTIAVFTRQNVPVPTVSIAPPTGITSSGAHLSGEVNPNGAATTCRFEVQRDATFKEEGYGGARSFPCSLNPGSGASPVSVDAEAFEREPGTKYRVRLVATNRGGTSTTLEPNPTFTTSPVAPAINNQSAIAVGLTDATLGASVTPGGAPTTYHFEYLDEASFLAEGFASPATRSTPEEGPVPGDNKEHSISAAITGLGTNTAYRFRVVATNVAGTVPGPEPAPALRTQAPSLFPSGSCPNEALRDGYGARLPDCDAYEMVSPVDKGGLWLAGFSDFFGAAPDGSAVTYMSTAGSGFPVAGGAHQDAASILAADLGESWSSQRLLTPESLGEVAAQVGMSRDLRFALVVSGTMQESALFLIDTDSGSITQISPTQNEIRLVETPQPFSLDAISEDGGRVFFESKARLTPEATPGRVNLYLWDHGALTVAGVLPEAEGGGAPPGGSFGGAYNWYEERLEIGGASSGMYVEAIHAATRDGGQIYFTAGESGQLYLRRGLGGSAPTTIRVSKPEQGVKDPFVEAEGLEGSVRAVFQEATPDGSRAFFTSSQKLTQDASTGEEDGGKDLYRYDEYDHRLVDITAGLETGENPNGAEVFGLLGASEDGSSGYFAAAAALAKGAVAGENNIYRFEENGDGRFSLTFVDRTSEGSHVCREASGVPAGAQNWSPSTFCAAVPSGGYSGKSSRVSPNGQELMFTKLEDIYRYSASSGEVICISCNPTGAASLGKAEVTAGFFNANAFEIPRSGTNPRLTHNLSDDGSRIFFQTPNSLLPEDTNGPLGCKYLIERPDARAEPSCLDVYEWEEPDAPDGTCKKVEVDGGCLYLLSSGKSEQPSFFIDASSDGSTAFLLTTSSLVPLDQDDLYDVYAVRSDGGIASQHVLPGPPCQEESCRGPAAQPSAPTRPGSSSFNGAGNPKPKPHKTKKKRCHKRKHQCTKKKQGQCTKKKQGQCKKKKQGHGASKKGGRK
jgi:DNA-binding beta-propeller fold protein YncE